ncbi:hypothetical protein MFLAVUS_009861 [Mucor flavus]|uniref:Uncharacterized protein n=1 Tax=Mucor flavus TaxID=439312 RepID=A0ABP9ZB46_9FUNG
MRFSGETTANDWCNKGMDQYDSRNYNAALDSFLKSAESNHAEAQHSIGVFYTRGFGVDIDYSAALSWYLKAAEQGHFQAQYNSGVFYNRGFGVDVDYSAALFWYLKAAEQGHLQAQNNIGVLYNYGDGVDVDYNVALSWYLKAAEQGHSTAKRSFVILYGHINGVEQEYNVARECFMKAAEGENTGIGQNYTDSMRWSKKVANDNDDEKIMHKVAEQFYYGQGVDKDYKEATHCFTKAAKSGYTPVQKSFGCTYQKGYDSSEDYRKAKNNIESCNSVELDLDKSFERYRLSAEAGDKEGQMKLGIMYLYGFATDIKLDVALEWFEKSLENGYEPARVYIDQVTTRKLESQLSPVDIDAETETELELELTGLKREMKEAKEQIAMLLAKLAIKDSEIENFTRYTNAAVPQVIPDLAQDKKDEKAQKQNCRNKPIKRFQL